MCVLLWTWLHTSLAVWDVHVCVCSLACWLERARVRTSVWVTLKTLKTLSKKDIRLPDSKQSLQVSKLIECASVFASVRVYRTVMYSVWACKYVRVWECVRQCESVSVTVYPTLRIDACTVCSTVYTRCVWCGPLFTATPCPALSL
jgi:hypothetical protein